MTEPNLNQIREFLLTKLGLDYQKKRERELYSKLSKAAKDFSFRDTNKFIDWLLQQQLNDSQTKLLASSLTIGETYFFREHKALDYIKQVHLPDLIRQRRGKNRKLKIWSAGCSTGEEPYSVAILLQQTIPDIKNWDITILATDINPTFLSKAIKGVYSEWSFRKTNESLKTGYFKKLKSNQYQINDSIKRMVTFSHLNLVSESYPSPQTNTNNFDIILCRNVLIYFSEEGTTAVAKKFYKALNINGMLAVSPVETSSLLSSSFSKVSFQGNTIFKKDPLKKLNSNNADKKKYSINILDSKFDFPVVAKKETLLKLPKIDSQFPKEQVKIEKSKVLKNTSESYNSALDYFNLGKLDEAEKLLNLLVTKEAVEQQNVLLLLAKVYAGKNQLDKSEEWCKKAINVDKINIEAYYLLSTIYSEQNKIKEAVQALNNILFLNPDFTIAHFLLGNICKKQGNIQSSVKHFENAKKCLEKVDENEIVHGSDGMSAGQLSSIIDSIKMVDKNVELVK